MSSPYIIDVRTVEEYISGHHPDAINIPLSDIESGANPECSFDTPIALYCRSGARAGVVKSILESRGYVKVENSGGLLDARIQL
jgi:phage shock protein E